MDLVGRGEGLTPAGDDVLAGALVAAHAIGDPRLHDWRGATRAALAGRRTTAVSVGMLHAALDGWSSPALADGLTALCGPDDPGPALERLLAVGHSSGRHLLDGVLHVLSTDTTRSRRMKHVEVRKGSYVDSVSLMQVSRRVADLDGVTAALVAMATDLNLELADGMGFDVPPGTSRQRDAGGGRRLTDDVLERGRERRSTPP